LARNWEVFNNHQQERREKEETTTSLDIDIDDESFCDSEGHYRPELEEEHDRRQRAELRESEIENDLSKSPPPNDGTILTRSPCALGVGWVRHRCVEGTSDDGEEKHKQQFHAKAETTTHEKAEATKKKKKQRENRKAAEEEGTTTAHKTGTRIQCLGCGDVITILPSRQFPEYCEPCTGWYYEVCDSFVELEQETGNNKEAETKLANLWAQQGRDPFYLQETRAKWKAGTTEEKQLEDSSASSSSSNSNSTSIPTSSSSSSSTQEREKDKKKKRKKRAKKVVTKVKEEENGSDSDDDDDDDDIDPRKLGWEECARRGRIQTKNTMPTRGRPSTRSTKQ
jgi:hypothetical protein